MVVGDIDVKDFLVAIRMRDTYCDASTSGLEVLGTTGCRSSRVKDDSGFRHRAYRFGMPETVLLRYRAVGRIIIVACGMMIRNLRLRS